MKPGTGNPAYGVLGSQGFTLTSAASTDLWGKNVKSFSMHFLLRKAPARLQYLTSQGLISSVTTAVLYPHTLMKGIIHEGNLPLHPSTVQLSQDLWIVRALPCMCAIGITGRK